MFWIALAAQSATALPPPRQNLQRLLDSTDYPKSALYQGEQGSVYFQVLVNPDGRVDTCTVLLSSGYKDLDDATCRLVTARARFSPPHGENGRAIYGTYRQVISWRLNSYQGPPSMPPDFELTINRAPEGVKLPVKFTVAYRVHPDGTTSRCQFDRNGTAKSVLPPPVLVDLACGAATEPPVQPVRNQKNEPIEAWDGATVRFSLKP
jgi:protein TonB